MFNPFAVCRQRLLKGRLILVLNKFYNGTEEQYFIVFILYN